MRRMIIVVLFSVLLSACAPSEETIKLHVVGTISSLPTQTSYPTYTANPTYTLNPTFTPYPTYTPAEPTVIVVTPTSSPTPLYTPTATLTPTETLDPLFAPHSPGIYLVGVDIGPGIWRSDPSQTGNNCYWEITSKTGDILRNHYGLAGGTMYISPNAFQVEMNEECGIWTYLGPR